MQPDVDLTLILNDNFPIVSIKQVGLDPDSAWGIARRWAIMQRRDTLLRAAAELAEIPSGRCQNLSKTWLALAKAEDATL